MDDAFSAGVAPGGLRSTQEIKILLCYILHTVQRPLPRDEVTAIIADEGMANYFDTEAAIEELLRLQHLSQSEDGLIATTVTGDQIGDTLSSRIPYSLRERSVRLALKFLKRRKIEEENRVEILPLMQGGCDVICSVMDGEEVLLSVTLRVADQRQAELIKDRFLEDPAILYRANLAVLTGDTAVKRAGTQLVIPLS